MRVYPAYARTIAAHLARGNQPVAIAVVLSSTWWWFDHVAKVCLRPDEWALGRWEFGYLQNQHVVAVWGEGVGPAQFGELLLELMEAGPRLVWARDLADWLLCDAGTLNLREWANELTGRAHAARAQVAEAAYTRGQLRDLERHDAEIGRALDLGRESVSFLSQRKAAERMVGRLFASPYAPVDEHAA